MRSLNCLCGFTSQLPELFVDHIAATGHSVTPEIQQDLKTPSVRDDFIATLLAIQTCGDPSEIGAVPVQPAIDRVTLGDE